MRGHSLRLSAVVVYELEVLKRLVADLSLDKHIPTEALRKEV
jgi:hypothetical protein